MRIEHVDKIYHGEVFEKEPFIFDLSEIYSIQTDITQSDFPSLDGTSEATSPKEGPESAPRTPAHKIPSGQANTPDKYFVNSPFSLTHSLRAASSPIQSPHSSTPISENVSFTKSFETPSLHSPIISDTSSDPAGVAAHIKDNLSSDTLLNWNTRLETPPRRLVQTPGPPRRRSPYKEVVTKKLFTTPERKLNLNLKPTFATHTSNLQEKSFTSNFLKIPPQSLSQSTKIIPNFTSYSPAFSPNSDRSDTNESHCKNTKHLDIKANSGGCVGIKGESITARQCVTNNDAKSNDNDADDIAQANCIATDDNAKSNDNAADDNASDKAKYNDNAADDNASDIAKYNDNAKSNDIAKYNENDKSNENDKYNDNAADDNEANRECYTKACTESVFKLPCTENNLSKVDKSYDTDFKVPLPKDDTSHKTKLLSSQTNKMKASITDYPVDSLQLFSQNESLLSPTQNKEHSKFKYPTATQHLATQVPILPIKDCPMETISEVKGGSTNKLPAVVQETNKTKPTTASDIPDETFFMSQWPDEVYDIIDHMAQEHGKTSKPKNNKVTDNITTKNKDQNKTTNAIKVESESVPDIEQDSFPMSQWDQDVLDKLDKAILSSDQKYTDNRVPDTASASKSTSTDVCNKNKSNIATSKLALFDQMYFQNKPMELNSKHDSIFGAEDLSDIDMTECQKFPGFAPAGKSTKLPKETLSNGLSNITNIKKSLVGPRKPKISKLNQFDKMSEMKVVNRTNSVIEKNTVKETFTNDSRPKLVTSIFDDEDFSDLKLPAGAIGFSSAAQMVVSRIPPKSSDYGDDHSMIQKTVPRFSGFSTAGGNKVNFSKESLDHIRSSQIPFDEKMNKSTKNPKKKLLLDKESSKEANSNTYNLVKSIFNDEDLSDLKIPEGAGGFSSAANKVLLTKNLEDGKDPAVQKPPSNLAGFSTAGGNKVSISKESLDYIRSSQVPFDKQMNTEMGMHDLHENENFSELELEPSDVTFTTKNQNENKPKFLGFATAAGSKVEVSELSLNHVRSSQVHVSGNNFEKCQKQGTTNSKISNETGNYKSNSEIVPKKINYGGFSTGSGNKVTVSDKSFQFIKSSQAAVNTIRDNVENKMKTSNYIPEKSSAQHVTNDKKYVISGYKRMRKESDKIDITPVSKLSRSRNNSKSSPKLAPDNEVVDRVRRKSADCHVSPLSSHVNKRRKIQRGGVAFHSPVTEKTMEKNRCFLSSSPSSHYTRPGMSPLLSSPKLESTIEETPVEQTSFVTPYNTDIKLNNEPSKKPEINKYQGSLMWKHDFSKISSKGFVNPKTEAISAKRPLSSLSPPSKHSKEELYELGVPDSAISVTADNAPHFAFSPPDYFTDVVTACDGCSDQLLQVKLADNDTTLTLTKALSAGYMQFFRAMCNIKHIKKKHVTEEWVCNHYREIVWKCARQETSHPHVYGGRTFTPDNVMLQLTHRYWVEVEMGYRSAIRLITEKDDTAAKPLTLVVSGINSADKTIQVSDGWYSLKCTLDTPLTVLVQKGSITIGSKLVSFCSTIVGPHGDGIPPIQAKTVLKLHLNYNAVRPAFWYAPLGYTQITCSPTLPIRQLAPNGGICACLKVIVIRRYPSQYLETLPDGKKHFHGEKVEIRRQNEYIKKKEKLIGEIELKICKDSTRIRGEKKKTSLAHIKSLQTGEDLYEAVNSHPDPGSVHCLLSSTQQELLDEYSNKFNEKRRAANNKQLMEEVAEQCPERRVTCLVKYKVYCYHDDTLYRYSYYLTAWRADKQEPLKEGQCYKIYNVSTSSYGKRSDSVNLSTVKNTQFREVSGNHSHLAFKPLCCVSKIPEKTQECDVYGLILQVKQTNKHTDIVLADKYAAKHVTLHGNLQDLGLSDIIKYQNTVYIQNIQITRYNSLYINEKSSISCFPRDNKIKEQLKIFKSNISSKSKEFWDELLENLDKDSVSEVSKSPQIPDFDKILNDSECFMDDDILIDDVPIDDIPLDDFSIESEDPFKTSTSQRNKPDKTKQTIPLFSTSLNTTPLNTTLEDEFGDISTCEVPVTDSAMGEYVTPVKSRNYDLIFQ